jgi:hypothetical protein
MGGDRYGGMEVDCALVTIITPAVLYDRFNAAGALEGTTQRAGVDSDCDAGDPCVTLGVTDGGGLTLSVAIDGAYNWYNTIPIITNTTKMPTPAPIAIAKVWDVGVGVNSIGMIALNCSSTTTEVLLDKFVTMYGREIFACELEKEYCLDSNAWNFVPLRYHVV